VIWDQLNTHVNQLQGDQKDDEVTRPEYMEAVKKEVMKLSVVSQTHTTVSTTAAVAGIEQRANNRALEWLGLWQNHLADTEKQAKKQRQ
jgi:hypothetical protein